MTNDTRPMLEVEGLGVDYPSGRFRRPPISVIEDVSLTIARGETVALVGESGSGKSTIGKAILGLAPVTRGTIKLDGALIQDLPMRKRRPLASDLQVVFQNPYGSLNPSLTIGQILAEPLVAGGMSRSGASQKIRELLARVRMPADAVSRYPASFSGGQRQRIAIARAVARDPKLIICDEPTSALDVSTQHAAMELFAELQSTLGVAYLFISHDLALVRGFADRVAVLRAGRIVEEGPARVVCDNPQHPYTKALVAAAPVPDPPLQRARRAQRQELLAELAMVPEPSPTERTQPGVDE